VQLVFEQRFPHGLNATSVGTAEETISSFPALSVPPAVSGKSLGFYEYSGSGVPTGGCPSGLWPAEQLDTGFNKALGALAIMDETLQSTLIISSFRGFATTNFMYERNSSSQAASMWFGLEGSIEAIPAGYRYAVVMHLGLGFNAAMAGWGDLLLRKSGKPHDLWKSDFSLHYLGYTTDNGAYYYYNTEPNKTYETTVLDLKTYAVAEHIPFRWVLYDSWFYRKGGETGHGWDPLNGVLNWTDADPAIFPSGLRYMFDKTGWYASANSSTSSSAMGQSGGTEGCRAVRLRTHATHP